MISSIFCLHDPKMLRFLLPIASAMLLSGWHAHAAEPAPRINCEAAHQRGLDLTPRGTGPLQLKSVYCQPIRSTPFPKSAPVVSPDGLSIAYVERDTILRVARLDGGDAWIDYQTAMGTFAHFDASARSAPAIFWATNSNFIWAATQEKLRPSGFAKSPLQPVKTAGPGSIEPLPLLRHGAGPLDALLWANGEGLAVAQFGTRGGYYRPEHADPDPSFAIVDAQRGVVKDALPFSAIATLKDRTPGAAPDALVRNAAATQLTDGRVRALLSVGQWTVWTEGQSPQTIADPYADDRHNRMTISPDGSRVLVGRLLRTAGGMCRRVGGCTPGHPVEGVLAALHDLETGRLLWSLRATVTADFEFPTPAISPDGRYALVGLVPDGDRPLIALIAMDDGKIVQTVPSPGGDYAMGFARGGLALWTSAYGLTALYDIEPGTRN